MQLLAEELREDEAVNASCKIAVLKEGQNEDSLYSGELAQIIISITTGVSTTLITDAIHVAVNRARDRGPVTPVNPNPANTGEQKTTGRHDVGDPS